MAEILDGKIVSQKLRAELKNDVAEFVKETGHVPGLAVILVGDDPASGVYVRNKHKGCMDVGMKSFEITYPTNVSEEELINRILELNMNPNVDGILVQLPLPKHINEERVINSIAPSKDVDSFTPENVGKIMIGNHEILPCTPAGIMEILSHYDIKVEGKHCVIIGRSNIVGKPMAMLLLAKNGTVTVCHSKTRNLADITRQADILVVAVGKPMFVKADMVKPGSVVIDVGINRTSDGKLVGDVDFNDAFEVASMITPVPGGVGPMTISMLLKNTLLAAKINISKNM